ncbi:hypothetical protein B0H16DRAFT_1715364 [Mycena metata]|uniref:JmjC domain-containing protein n=1 Tax=Mycena metata TaxID=1033252 RepID=A0AAD7NQ24_9AGAR|nr:hypothetical protein B0H16DRAFT_1715364 [Mycena metata]
MNSDNPSLFHIPGPWVHPATKSLASDSVDIAELARKIHAHVPEISRADGVKLLNAAKNDACGSLTNLSIFDRATYLTALEISNVPNYGMLNSRTLPNIKHGLATVLAVDMLLHCSDPPTSSHPPVPQRASRPGGNDRFDKHFLAYKSWRWVLVKGNKLQDKIKTIASRVDPDLEGRPERAVSRMLAYKNLNDTYQPGSVAEHNLVQVVFFFSALTKGYTSLSKTRVWDVALSDIRRDDPTVTMTDVKGIIKNPNPKGIISAASVALCISPLFLLMDVMYTTASYSPNLALFQTWMALGNAHRLDPQHPLGRIERRLWNLILSAAGGRIDAGDIPSIFFADGQVQSLVQAADAPDPAGYNRALCFPSESLVSSDNLHITSSSDTEDEDDEDDDDLTPPAPARIPTSPPRPSVAAPGSASLDTANREERGEPVTKKPRLLMPPAPARIPTPPRRPSVAAPGSSSLDTANREERGEPVTKKPRLLTPPVAGVQAPQEAKDAGAGPQVDMEEERDSMDKDILMATPPSDGEEEVNMEESREFMDEDILTPPDEHGEDDAPSSGNQSSTPNQETPEKPAKGQKTRAELPPLTIKTRSSNRLPDPAAVPPAQSSSSTAAATSTRRKSKKRAKASVNATDAAADIAPAGWVRQCPNPAPAREEVFGAVVDRSKLYPLTSESVSIDFYELQHPGTPNGLVRGRKRSTEHRAFEQSAAELREIEKIRDSQPLTPGDAYYGYKPIPLHAHPNSQLFHSSGKIRDSAGKPLLPDIIPSSSTSSVFVVVEELWSELTGRQIQELLRRRLALVLHRTPLCRPLKFDADGLAEYTHPRRDAFVQDLGAKPADGKVDLKNGRPMDLVHFRKQRLAREAQAEISGMGPPREGQALNLLSNVVPEKTIATPAGWSEIATHEAACNYLRGVEDVPTFEFPWGETKWSIFANKGVMTWLHTDILFTVVMLPCGEKLWYMPASTIHGVLSDDDCIGVGLHGVPMSNSTHCVLTALHNSIAGTIHTNANHEIARQFLLKNFQFVCMAMLDPRHRYGVCRGEDDNDNEADDDDDDCLPQRIRDHLPDLETAEGVLDLLALRSFVILYLALATGAYDEAEKSTVGPYSWALPVGMQLWEDVMCGWMLVVDLDEHITNAYTFATRGNSALPDFETAANFVLTSMAASMSAYRKARKDLNYPDGLPKAFTATRFTEQLGQMLGRFDVYRMARAAGEEESVCAAQRDAPMGQKQFQGLALVEEFNSLCEGDENLWLIEWDSDTLPFTLTKKI